MYYKHIKLICLIRNPFPILLQPGLELQSDGCITYFVVSLDYFSSAAGQISPTCSRKEKATTHVHAHTAPQQGAASWCSHWQDVSALDFSATQPFAVLQGGGLPFFFFPSMLFCASMPALIVVIDWLSWCCRIQNNNAGRSSSGKYRACWLG